MSQSGIIIEELDEYSVNNSAKVKKHKSAYILDNGVKCKPNTPDMFITHLFIRGDDEKLNLKKEVDNSTKILRFDS